MQPTSSGYLDAYALVPVCTRAAVDRFLSAYINDVGSEDWQDREVNMLPPGYEGEPGRLEDWRWVPVRSLDEAVEPGLIGANDGQSRNGH